jgi:hypothetical protein
MRLLVCVGVWVGIKVKRVRHVDGSQLHIYVYMYHSYT